MWDNNPFCFMPPNRPVPLHSFYHQGKETNIRSFCEQIFEEKDAHSFKNK